MTTPTHVQSRAVDDRDWDVASFPLVFFELVLVSVQMLTTALQKATGGVMVTPGGGYASRWVGKELRHGLEVQAKCGCTPGNRYWQPCPRAR
jgi:hypothetical protein